jgi:hypothetical protein
MTAERLVAPYVQVYNEQRRHSALGYITLLAMLAGRQTELHVEPDRKIARRGVYASWRPARSGK